jgi:hypothetical protein
MATLTKEERPGLLAVLATLDAGQAEQTPPNAIFPVPEHVRAIEPDVALVVGSRGAGKTLLVRAFEDPAVRGALLVWAPTVKGPTGDVVWRTAWPLLRAGPDAASWSAFARRADRAREDCVAVWFAYLIRALGADLAPADVAELAPLLEAPGLEPNACLSAYLPLRLAATRALDRLDDALERQGAWRFLAYDEIDTLVIDDWAALGQLVRGLVSLWAAYARRWKRIRPKIFLRSDFYEHHREIAGADVAKLSANRVELQWSDANLYAALFKHILNKEGPVGDAPLREHLSRAVRTEKDAVLGFVPRVAALADAKPFVDRLVDEHMGANASKGLSLRWILDHLRDGNKRITPRSLVILVEQSARKELAQPRAAHSHLLHHTAVRNALDDVSKSFVSQAETNELRWIPGLRERLTHDRQVPWTRRELLGLLSADFDMSWGAGPEAVRPPGATRDEVLDTLLELGIVRRRSADSFDVPDIYLAGFGLTRKGGVARK